MFRSGAAAKRARNRTAKLGIDGAIRRWAGS
jgi:hypothetical protein